jgi:hypothetical protein
MFARWRTKIVTARTTVKTRISHGLPVSTTSTGMSAVTVSDATDE